MLDASRGATAATRTFSDNKTQTKHTMTRPQITPGPWRLKDNEHEDFRIFGNCEGGALARVLKSNNFGATEQDKANACAISALPDLLDALELAEATLQRLAPDGSRATQGTRDVITQALITAGYTF